MSVTIAYDVGSSTTFQAPALSLTNPMIVSSAGFIGAAIALVAAVYFRSIVLAENPGSEKMQQLRKSIFEGAWSYLATQTKWLSLWVIVMFVLIMCIIGFSGQDGNFMEGVYTAICFLIGSAASASAGWIGMLIATQANARTCEACKTSISRGLQISFASGAVMGNAVVGLGLLGLSVLYIIFTYGYNGSLNVLAVDNGDGTATYSWSLFSGVFNRLAGFGFGASTIGMFARVGGGVFTKAADVGSDLVGKVEQGIPEDDPRNPAVIADNVGDNVGDVAGMGADLFESYAGAVIATCTLAPRFAADSVSGGFNFLNQSAQFQSIMISAVALPFWINGFGIIASIIGTQYVRYSKLEDDSTLEYLLKVIT